MKYFSVSVLYLFLSFSFVSVI